jgi:hypothetical protein
MYIFRGQPVTRDSISQKGLSGNSNPGDRIIYTNSYTGTLAIIGILQIEAPKQISRKDVIVDTDSTQEHTWVQKGGAKEQQCQ